MAIKFSQFNAGATVADIDFIVGYKAADNVQIPIGLVTVNTTYSIATAQDGANESLTLTGVGPSSTDVITFTAGADIILTDDGVGNGFTIAASGPQGTVTSVDYTSDITAFTAAGGPITASGTLTLNKNGGTAGQYIDGAAGAWTTLPVSDTYDLNPTTNGSSVDVNLTSSSGTDNSLVTLTPSGGLTITQAGDIITVDGSAMAGTVTSVSSASTATALTLDTSVSSPNPVITLGVTGGIAGQYLDGAAGAWTTLPADVTSFNQVAGAASTGAALTAAGTGAGPYTGTVTVASNAFAGGANIGHVPDASGAGGGTFLKEDGTWAVAGGVPTKTVNTFTISGAATNTLVVTSATNPVSVNYIDVYINGVYQAKANATLSVKTLTLAAGFYPDGAVIETVTTT